MNYLAHGLAYLDGATTDELTPYRVAGTALPDWLRVVDKRARLGRRGLDAPKPAPSDARDVALLAGAEMHHEDDHLFHTADAFDDEAHRLSAAMREVAPGLRASTIAHIAIEMLLDAQLIADDEGRLHRYYDALDIVDAHHVAHFAARETGRELPLAVSLIDRFRRSRFLFAYRNDDGLLACLQGVCERAKMAAPTSAVLPLLAETRERMPTLMGTLHLRHQERFASSSSSSSSSSAVTAMSGAPSES